jgi:hypothetical protein
VCGTVAAQPVPPEIIRHDKNDIGRSIRSHRTSEEREQSNQMFHNRQSEIFQPVCQCK